MLIVTLVTLLAACSQGPRGTYSDSAQLLRYTFEADGKASVSLLGQVQQARYVREGDTVTVHVPGSEGEPVAFTVNEDGSLQGPMGVRLEQMKP
ncbi:hypothetical protein ABB26_12145 [Stenotrophomonas humi]|uniref:Uncharacterized protein n=1 Tax=Stenotrophomonas humi TaxID=405444 RepID=A0A0R0C1F9_9GAMM|nr:hypothetical protein ABB26_12145 [Stenotrophomonas humi]